MQLHSKISARTDLCRIPYPGLRPHLDACMELDVTGTSCMHPQPDNVPCTPPAQVFMSHLVAVHASSSLAPLRHAPMMDAAEKQLVLQGFNQTTRPYDASLFVHGMFAEHAARQPQAPCIIFEDQVYSYAEVGLHAEAPSWRQRCPWGVVHRARHAVQECAACCLDNGVPDGMAAAQPSRHGPSDPPFTCSVRVSCLQVDAAANHIAHHLRNKAGAVPGDIIGVLALRSPLMVATLLAVFKCGCGYLPLDHHHPEARIAFMLEDAAVKVTPE